LLIAGIPRRLDVCALHTVWVDATKFSILRRI